MPAGNMEGTELLVAFGLEQFPGTVKGTPDFASLSNDFTCIIKKGDVKTISPTLQNTNYIALSTSILYISIITKSLSIYNVLE